MTKCKPQDVRASLAFRSRSSATINVVWGLTNRLVVAAVGVKISRAADPLGAEALGEAAMRRKEWSEAKAAHERRDYVIELQLYQKMADEGDARAQANLGVMYDKGRGTAQDFNEALKWFHRAANAGEARALCNVGA